MDREATPQGSANLPGTRPLRVFVVDDSAVMVQAICNVVEGLPGLVVTGRFSSALDALAAVERDPPDLVLMDVRMPHMNGLEATRRLHRDFPQIQIIIVTGLDAELRRVCELAGASGFINKPRLHQELPGELARLLIPTPSPIPLAHAPDRYS